MNFPRLIIIFINLVFIVGCSTVDPSNSKYLDKENTEKTKLVSKVEGLGGLGATNNIPVSKTINTCPFINTPEIVLFGTDVYPVDEFKGTTTKKTEASGVYISEQGGASAKVQISLVGNTFKLTRTFIEPGKEGILKSYKEIEWHKCGLLVPSVLYGFFSKERLLLWEADSQVEGIPGSMWILYKKKEE